MRESNPFAAPGNWYRGNLHTHTTVSDGDLNPSDMCEVYREAGYDFVYLTDHHKVADVTELSTDEFLALPGAELSGNAGERVCDLLSINIRETPNLSGGHPGPPVRPDLQRCAGARRHHRS